MTLLLKEVRIKDPKSSQYNKIVDLSIKDGKIDNIGTSLHATSSETVIDGKGQDLYPGLIDVGVFGGDPGLEHRESIKTLLSTAEAGGFTDIYYYPNLNPVTHSISEIEYIHNRASVFGCRLHPIGAISRHCEGEDITEMYDMSQSGVRCFSDGKRPVKHGGLLLRALLYVKKINGLIINHPSDDHIFPEGHMHEGQVSTRLGLRGIPDITETIMLERDLHLAEYTGSRLHVAAISSTGSVQLLRKAKAKGLKVTASVPIWNLCFTDEALEDFDTNYKMQPPLRTAEDREALIEGLKDGTIDCITSHHTPIDQEEKALEFPYAKPGAVALQLAWAISHQHLSGYFNEDELVKFWVDGPSQVMGTERAIIDKGQKINAFLYDKNFEYNLNKINNKSKSINYPNWSTAQKGAILATFIGQRYNSYFNA